MPIPRFAGEQLSFENGVLFFGDNLEVLSKHVADESVDLVYLDPPFKSNKSYNMLFKHKDGREAAGQRWAFDDMWRWDLESARVYDEIVAGGGVASDMIRGLRAMIGTNDMLAYITMMTPRLLALRRVMKPTASLFLHCDPTASHYLKLMLDAVFGPTNFRNEIVWQRVAAKGGQMGRLPANHDLILSYCKAPGAQWNEIRLPYSDDELDEKTLSKYRYMDEDGRRYRLGPLLHPEQGKRPNLDYELMGVCRTWRWSRDRMQAAVAAGRVVQTAPGRVPQQKMYLDEQPGRLVGDVWTDVSVLNSRAAERLGYPTQKPVALLERVIAMASSEGDLVLDPFCGCGTTIDAAQRLGRKWIGIDVTKLAIDVIRERLANQFGAIDYAMGGEPRTREEAEALAELDKHEFQRWACEKIGISDPVRKGGDRGIDGRIVGTFDDGSSWTALVSVKGGKVRPDQVRDLHGTISNAGAYIGIFISLHDPTRGMKHHAAEAGFTETGEPRLQLLTVDDLLAGEGPALPARAAPAPTQERWLRAV